MIKVGVLGYGVVGTGIVELIDRNKENNNLRGVIITSILVRNKEKHLNKKYFDLITENANDVFNENNNIIIELIGGINPAYEYIKRALKSGVNVITANKELIAERGDELFKLAKQNGVSLKFEASVAGGIPIIKPMVEMLQGNKIESITGILNGTTNFILTKMYEDGLDYNSVLQKAKELGFAESNPDADVLGYDASRKLSILMTLGFNNRVVCKDIKIKGITDITTKHIAYAKNKGFKIKLIAKGYREKDSVYAAVQPMLIDNDSMLYNVNNEVNAVVVNGDAVGELAFIGKGAGMLPTASAVYGDLLDILNDRNTIINSFNSEVARVNNLVDNELKAILIIKSERYENVLNEVKKEFLYTEIIEENEEELALLIKACNEEQIDNLVKYLEVKDSNIDVVKYLTA
ncbi:homoserine dehydrogenase [Clostridium cavendishii DSM 21758]|uniref:Homoserine dehydrogenase n=1 Tax=Clostridium cavendishii DSM 21758 TaxID=1121302 RepID=A0A1M6LTW1_9CLOT|nr:homoserine dehydrogenase [Clostridium cavendishii]SHJ74641.1 homoserine dehydrogenase [Clostridium cavendishii DSM 21758]